MNRRIELHEKLVDILGSRNVYFQPPPSYKINYPCIIYSRSNYNVKYANNHSYRKMKKYSVIVIDKNPDSEIPEKLQEAFLYCSFDRHYTADNLNHDSYTLFF